MESLNQVLWGVSLHFFEIHRGWPTEVTSFNMGSRTKSWGRDLKFSGKCSSWQINMRLNWHFWRNPTNVNSAARVIYMGSRTKSWCRDLIFPRKCSSLQMNMRLNWPFWWIPKNKDATGVQYCTCACLTFWIHIVQYRRSSGSQVFGNLSKRSI